MEHEQQHTHVHDEPVATPTTPATTPAPDNSLLMGILCYLGILLIIPYLMDRDNAFVKFHLKQGMVLLVIELVIYALGMTHMFYSLWSLIGLVNLGVLVLAIIGIVNVVQKKQSPLPLVGGFAEKIHI